MWVSVATNFSNLGTGTDISNAVLWLHSLQSINYTQCPAQVGCYTRACGHSTHSVAAASTAVAIPLCCAVLWCVVQNGGGVVLAPSSAAATPPGPEGSPQAPELELEDEDEDQQQQEDMMAGENRWGF